MAGYCMTPTEVPPVETAYRCIRTKLPVPESLSVIEAHRAAEPVSMAGQPPIVWDRAEGVRIHDAWGNTWLDWSSGVLVTNAGHGREAIRDALREVIDAPLLATYVFMHSRRAELAARLRALAPKKAEYRVFLLSTGSEATENAIKLARTYGVHKGGPRKRVIVSFENAFHGRTLGAQLAGGIPGLKEWIVDEAPSFVQTPFPDGFINENLAFDQFLATLDAHGLTGADVAGVISESYQGVGPDFFPDAYAKALEAWCRDNDVALIMDEVQSGFGRTGRMFAYEHYGIEPDLVCCGKGISSSLPLSAVIGREDIMGLYAPGSMTSTHSGSPLPVAAALASLELLEKERLVENAAALGPVLEEGLRVIRERHSDRVGTVCCRGLVAGLKIVEPGTKTPDKETAYRINEACFRKGLLLFSPVGLGGGCVKIAPPLCTPRDALEEGIGVMAEACDEVFASASCGAKA